MSLFSKTRSIVPLRSSRDALFRVAAEHGNARGEDGLGVVYANGLGIPQDFVQAAIWFRRAANKGNADAQHSLGLMYANGLGVPLDYEVALMWSYLAFSRAENDATRNKAMALRDALTSHMTPDQIAEAKRNASEWVSK